MVKKIKIQINNNKKGRPGDQHGRHEGQPAVNQNVLDVRIPPGVQQPPWQEEQRDDGHDRNIGFVYTKETPKYFPTLLKKQSKIFFFLNRGVPMLTKRKFPRIHMRKRVRRSPIDEAIGAATFAGLILYL